MPCELITPRLRLIALSETRLRQYRDAPAEFEAAFGLPVSRQMFDADVTRAVNFKLAKMAKADARNHEWLTYWLIVIQSVPIGVGLIGFKGCPDFDGKTEVGYGIDAAWRNRGYVTEALTALSTWAFAHSQCRRLTAGGVVNPASEGVLRKSGWRKTAQRDNSSDWELERPEIIGP